MAKAVRVGPKMQSVVYYVKNHPGCTKADAARFVWHHTRGWQKYGYAAVDRAIKAKLVIALSGTRKGTYALHVAES